MSHEDKGLTYYQLQPEIKYANETNKPLRDETHKIQVVTLGPLNEKPTKAVMLLRETGSGKTTLLTCMINHLYGVKLDQNRRLFLKEQQDSAPRSQTNWVTAYVIYHQDGMPYCHNHVSQTLLACLTRGEETINDRQPTSHMTFLSRDFGIDDLNCIGLVVKAQEKIIHDFHKCIMCEVKSYLSNDVEDLECLLVTHATNTTPVVQLVRESGIIIHEDKMLKFDNWPLIVSKCYDSPSEDDRSLMTHSQNVLNRRYTDFFDKLSNSRSVSLKKTRELPDNHNSQHPNESSLL